MPGARTRTDRTVEHQTIVKWAVVGSDRLIGAIHHRPGTASGKTIMTSPVVQVRFMGVQRTPVAFTESGNAYWLGEPADSFGLDRAEAFVWQKSRAEVAPARSREAGMETSLIRLMD
jgi:hypothetical protein